MVYVWVVEQTALEDEEIFEIIRYQRWLDVVEQDAETTGVGSTTVRRPIYTRSPPNDR
jgi:hypothetical protein